MNMHVMNQRLLTILLLLSTGLLYSCAGLMPAGLEEETRPCLDWKTMVVEKKERLPYPMSGVVVREETIVYCREYDTTSV